MANPTPYALAFDPARELLFARGAERQLKALLAFPGSNRAHDPGAPGGCVSVPASRAAFLAAEAIATPESVSPEYREQRQHWMKVNSALLTHLQARVAALELARPLLPHQEEFCALAVHRRGMLNASEQGTGKTTTGWTLAALWGGARVLIVCPKSLVGSWAAEKRTLWPDDRMWFRILELGSGKLTDRKLLLGQYAANERYQHRTVAIVNYEALKELRAPIDAFAPQTVILDESWRVKNPRAQVTEECLRHADAAEHVLCLTGTPIGNDVGDLWAQLRMLGPETVPQDYWRFLHRYATLVPIRMGTRTMWKPAGVADPADLMRLIDPVWYRATKATCLDLPPKQFRTVKLKLPAATARLYAQVKEDGEAALGAPLSLAGERTVALRLQQIAGGHRPTPQDEFGRKWEPVPFPACPKIAWLKEWVQDVLVPYPEARAIIWCRFNAEVARIGTEIAPLLGEHRMAQVWGATDNNELEALKSSFNSRSEDGVQVLVAQIKKLAFGHNLQAADHHIRFSHSWSYVETSQAEDRSHRLGRTEAVSYVDLVAMGTLDEEIVAALTRKQDLALRLAPDTTGDLEEDED